jgi:1-deoxy-D-xylulose-5-phosphate synthase
MLDSAYKPLDEAVLHEVCKTFKHIITVEDGTKLGGFGSAVLEFMAKHHYTNSVETLGIPDYFLPHGTQLELYKECGFDSDSIYTAVKKLV